MDFETKEAIFDCAFFEFKRQITKQRSYDVDIDDSIRYKSEAIAIIFDEQTDYVEKYFRKYLKLFEDRKKKSSRKHLIDSGLDEVRKSIKFDILQNDSDDEDVDETT